jgi:drug/metabolite transporter, DME family
VTSARHPPGIALVGLAALLWAMIGLFTPALLDLGLSAFEIAFWRALLGGACFAVHAAVRRRGLAVRSRRDAVGMALFGVISVGVFYAALAMAIDLGGVSLAWILLYTAPGWVAVGAVALLGEHIDRVRGALVIATMAGVALVAIGGGEGIRVSAASLTWGLLSGLSYASWYIGGKRFLPRYHPVTISAWTLLVGAVVLLPVAGVRELTPRAWLLLLGLSVLSTYLPALLYYSGLRSVDASRAAIVATIEPVAALLIGATVGRERLGILAVLGTVIVLGATTLASVRPQRRER